MEFVGKTDQDVKQWIANHEKNGATDSALYRALIEERSRREQTKSKLRFDVSLAALTDAAIVQTCTTYGELAAASDVAWTQAHRQFSGAGGHLDQMLTSAMRVDFHS